MVLHALTFARSRGRCWKPRPKAAVFNTSQGTWYLLMHWKTMFDRYYCIKTENICYISRYFLHYFDSPFHWRLTNAISTDYARSRAWQFASRNSSKSVAPVRAYWKLRSRALIHGFSPVNARLLMTFGTAFYAIIEDNHYLLISSPEVRLLSSMNRAAGTGRLVIVCLLLRVPPVTYTDHTSRTLKRTGVFKFRTQSWWIIIYSTCAVTYLHFCCRESEDCLRASTRFLWILYMYSLVHSSSNPNYQLNMQKLNKICHNILLLYTCKCAHLHIYYQLTHKSTC